MTILDFFKSVSKYFSHSAGVNKYFSGNNASNYDYILLFILFTVIISLTLYFLWPSFKKRFMDRKIISFIVEYKNISGEEKRFIKNLTKKYKLKEGYELYISKDKFEKCSQSELKTRMLRQESENSIKEFINTRDILLKKLFFYQ